MRRRVERLNSLIKEVLCEVIRHDIKHAPGFELTTISQVALSNDLKHARVLVSIIGTSALKQELLHSLRNQAGYIAVLASKKMVMRFFPNLTFHIDDSVDKMHRIESLLKQVLPEKQAAQAP